MSMKNINTHVLEEIVKQNEGRSGHVSGCNVKCYGISCSTCPMNFNVHRTLEALRDELTSRTSTPANIHSVLCSYERSADKQECDCTTTGGVTPSAIEGVTKPSHYAFFDGIEAIEVIARSMTVEMFRGYCMGNMLKYRLRAGKKSELAYAEKDLAKANFYAELFEKHKGECYDFRNYQP